MSTCGRRAGRTCWPAAGQPVGLGWLLEAGRSGRVVGEAGLAGEGLLRLAAPRSRGWVAPERFLSPTRWHWEPCYGVPVPPVAQPGLPPHPSSARTGPTALLDREQGTEGPVHCTPALFHRELPCHLGAGVSHTVPVVLGTSASRMSCQKPVPHTLTRPH